MSTKKRNYTEIQDNTMSMLSKLTESGHQANIHVIDNDASYIIKQGLTKNNIQYQLVLTHLLRQNAAEHNIQMFKENSITCLCAVDPDYPAKDWDRSPTQLTLTLNLLRNLCLNTKLSAYASLHDVFEHKKTLLDPLGIRLLVYEKTTNCRTWEPHVTDGWNIGPDLEHY